LDVRRHGELYPVYEVLAPEQSLVVVESVDDASVGEDFRLKLTSIRCLLQKGARIGMPMGEDD